MRRHRCHCDAIVLTCTVTCRLSVVRWDMRICWELWLIRKIGNDGDRRRNIKELAIGVFRESPNWRHWHRSFQGIPHWRHWHRSFQGTPHWRHWHAFVSCWCINTLRPWQNGRHFPDDIFKCIFLNESISFEISLNFVPTCKSPINNIPALVQIMAWRRPGDKPLSEPMMVRLPTHICVTRPQWFKLAVNNVFMTHYLPRVKLFCAKREW